MKGRILSKDTLFTIGEIRFRVIGLVPEMNGLVCAKTYIQCNEYIFTFKYLLRFYSSKSQITRALLLTTQKYSNFNQEFLLKEFFSETESLEEETSSGLLKENDLGLNNNNSSSNNFISNSGEFNRLLIKKNSLLNLNNKFMFFVRNCEPETGVINTETFITIENRELSDITKIKLAVLKSEYTSKLEQSHLAKERVEEYVKKQYIHPYFFSGIKKYIERGDLFSIESLGFFVVNSCPDHGFITSNTVFSFKLGLTQEECLIQMENSDNLYLGNMVRGSNSNLDSNFEDYPDLDSNSRTEVPSEQNEIRARNLFNTVYNMLSTNSGSRMPRSEDNSRIANGNENVANNDNESYENHNMNFLYNMHNNNDLELETRNLLIHK